MPSAANPYDNGTGGIEGRIAATIAEASNAERKAFIASTKGAGAGDALVKRATLQAGEYRGVAGVADDLERSVLLEQRKPLGQMLREGIPAPTFLGSPSFGERLFYEGHVALFAGHKKAGKSWALTILTRDCMAAGRPVVYLDFENGPDIFGSRLELVGVDPERVDDFIHYVPFPADLTEPDALRGEFERITQQLPGALVVIDSLRSLMSRFNLNPEKNVEVERVFQPIMAAVKTGPEGNRLTVVTIDHSNRNTSGEDDYVATGAAAKAQAVDAVYFFQKAQPFSRDVEGVVKITVKERMSRSSWNFATAVRV